MRNDQCQKILQIDDPKLAGNTDVAVQAVSTMETGKRRRGRPPKNQVRSSAPLPQRKNDDEEDVCFICFDGGSLVLCDRRGCPKAYHPACIKRDEAFFKSAAKWNCGWHICSACQKASHYMCYTCTYSVCKNCTKDADYLNVRGNKGFCGTCMRIVLLIEYSASGNEETVQVDFDDKTSWEYLFKVYWVLLKEKLSLRLDELTNAKNPLKETAIMGSIGYSSGELNNYKNAEGTNMEKSDGDQGDSYSKRRKTIKQQKLLNNVEYLESENQGVMKGMPFPGGTDWATTELLSFVAHMKNGDVPVLSHFCVQELLLEYITQNNLRDPRQKSHIICDSMLMKLFRKERVGHFEMLKLLESHFLIEDHSRAIDTIRGGGIEAVSIHMATDRNNDKRSRTRKKVDEKVNKANPDEYAAVDVHNMNLIYLKRNLIENLIDDAENVYDKVVGSFVRIKIPGSDQRHDLYRLVQVVGTRKAEPYEIGERTTEIMLEILNFDKKEVVAIDGVSNQDFSEDECRRVHQRVTCGLTKWFTVGEIQEKAMALQAVRVKDWLQSDILRVTNLRDRASEKGHMKEHRECIEKLQLLNSPDERQRRLHEVPDIHCDPDMKRYCKPLKVARELDEKKDNMKPRGSGFSMKEEELNGNDDLTDIGSRGTSLQPHATVMELSVNNIETDTIWHYQDPLGKIQGPFAMAMLRRWSMSGHFPPGLRIWRVSEKQDDSILLTDALDGLYGLGKQLSFNSCMPTEDIRVASNDGCSGFSMKEKELNGNDDLTDIGSRGTSLQPQATVTELSVNNIETDTIWNYQDPLGKIQGPFAMEMLRRWSMSGHFPPGLRIWRASEKQDDSILLTDALDGLYGLGKQLSYNCCMPTEDIRVASNDGCRSGDGDGRQSTDLNAAQMESKQVEGTLNSKSSDVSGHCGGNNESMKEKEMDFQSSPSTAAVDIINSNAVQKGIPLSHCESVKGVNKFPGLPPVSSSLPSSTLSGKPCETQSHQFNEDHRVEILASGSINMNVNMNKTSDGQIIAGSVKQDNSGGRSGIPSGQHRRSHSDDASNGGDSNSGLSSLTRALEASEHNPHVDIPDIPTSTIKMNQEDSKGQATESKQSLCLNVPHQDSGPRWSTASSLVGNSQLPEVVGEWGGHSSTPANPYAKEWDSDIVPESSFKPCSMGSDHATTPTSGSGHLTHSSSMDPANNVSAWDPVVPEPNEGDESVSDLLAEVEAMESLNGLTSPTSIMRCTVEFAQGSESICFSPVGGVSPTPDPRKSDAFSSTNDLQMPSQSTVTTEPFGVSQSEVLAQKRSGGHSSTSAEINKNTRPSDVSVNQYKAGSDMQPPAPPATTWGMDATDTAWRTGPVTTSTNYGAVHGNANFSSKGQGQGQGTTNFYRETGQGKSHENSSINSGASAENPPYCGSQPRYISPRHRDPHGRDSNSARGRSSLSRHSSYYGGPNGVGTFKPPPKGLRICKFYESGYCKKGASCRYWHP